MKLIEEFLSELAVLDIKLRVEENRLRCNAPQGVLTSEIRSQLSTHKAEIIQFLQNHQLQTIPRNPRNNEPLPLSWAQERLWFLDQLEGSSSTYNMPGAISINGKLDINAFQSALSEIVRRHEVLRASFENVSGKAIQVIHSDVTMNINVVDLQQYSKSERDALLEKQAQVEADTPFNLEIAPLIRCSLLQLDANEYVLFITMHHIISDDWSMGVFVEELSSLYQAFCAGEPSPLAELPIQYGDFAIWQKKWLSGEVLQTQLDYWVSHLAGAPELLQLPTDYQRPSTQSYQGTAKNWTLNTGLTQKLKNLSQKSGTTLFMTLLAGFTTLLHRYTNQRDILIGSSIANRNRSEIEPLIGFFINNLVLRTIFEDNPTFENLLQQVKENTLKAYDHQDVPFEQIVEAIQPQRSLAYSPLFQVMFDLQNSPGGTVELPDLTFSEFSQERAISQFDLTVSVTEVEGRLECEWEYNTDLFDASTIERMATHFQNLLHGIVENPLQKVAELPLLCKSEGHQLLTEWNNTAKEYPTDKCVHQLFEEQVENNGDAIAVVFENEQLTYQQLNQRANQLAHHLQSLGVGKEVLVGICLERSIDMVVSVLAVLKAGGAYVPLDPNYPQERLNYILDDAAVEILITKTSLIYRLPTNQTKLVLIDDNQFSSTAFNPVNKTNPNNLAYVIYTSGSTGKPKATMIEHRGCVNHCYAMIDTLELKETDTIAQTAPIGFDISVWQILTMLLVGGRVCVIKNEIIQDPSRFFESIEAEEITVVQVVPSLLATMLDICDHWGAKQLSHLRWLSVTGEAFNANLMHWWFKYYPSIPLLNAYGPAECSDDVTLYPICYGENTELLNSNTIPIGKPIANTQIYILDVHLNPVAIGVAGELYVGGIGVGRGYLNRPQLTSEKFIPNPFSSNPEEKLYKTGDLGRYLADGNIEFLGRIDNQVKVRGFRIELGEIEAALNSHPQVTQTVVTTTEERPGNKRLVAYVVIEQSLTNKELRDYLKTQIPEYMVPSTFVTLDALPLTPNGKIDRKALPTPNFEERENPYIEARTEIEKTLAEIWSSLLLIDFIGINDNFFEIGGDSILSIQVVSRAKNAGIQISAKQIFQHQTIAELARVAGTVTAVECNQGIVTGSAALTPIQEWFLAENKPEAHHYNQSVLLEIPTNTKPELIEKALLKLINHHDALRLRFPSLSEHQQINYGLVTAPLNIIDLSSTPQKEQSQQIENKAKELQGSLNLSTGAIMQAALFNLGENQNGRLLIIIHHLVVDGVSWRILLSDLQTIYQQLINKKPIKLEAKTTAFIDWAKKINEYANSERIQSELEYWCNQPWDTIKPLPLDYPSQKQSNTIDTAVNYSVKLNQSETKALLGKVNEAYNTQINDILLSALAISCSNWTGNSTIAIDLEGHGREEIFDDVDLSRTVGWFTSLFPVLLQRPNNYQISDVIKSIKEQLRAIPNRGIGYGILRYLREPSEQTEQLQTTPTPEICFNYLGQFDQVQSESDWKFGTESVGDDESPKQNCEYLLEINSLVIEGCLQLNWTYSSKVHNSETVEKLAQNYIEALKSIIEHCQLPSSLAYTPSDFSDANLTQLELDELLTTIQTNNNTNLKNISAIYPLSPTQQGMLFHSFYAPESGMYFEQTSLNIKGNLDIFAFESAWQKVVDRYSILRTLFIWENRQTPLQVVLKQVKLPFKNLDWRNFSETEQQQKLENLLQTHREQGFNFNQAPVMNCTLVKLTEDNYQFVWNYHHALMDAWCLSIIFKEVLSFYEASVAGEALHLPSPRPYQDYITWLNQQDDVAAKSFWQNTLQGFSAPTPLVVDKKQSQIESLDSDYHQINLRLSEKVSQKLQDLSVKSHLTVSTIVQAAWALLLSRYSGSDDVLFGVTVSGRPGDLSGVEEMVGLFINTLPLRVRVSPQMSLTAWMEQVQNSIMELQEYSYTPLVEIQAISEIPAQTPLFDSILVFENNSFDTSELNDICPLELDEGEGFERVNYPLTLTVVASQQLSMNIGYDTDCFDADTIERMLGHLQTILCSIADNPQQQLNQLPLLSQGERHQLLSEWNNTAREYPTHQCIHQLFEEQVEKTPDAVAVSFAGEKLSYIELNQKANQLAHHLQSLGVGAEVLVGICLERSMDMVVSVLAVLKAGGAYVPLDPNYPQERLNYILDDAAVEILITKTSLIYRLPTNETKLVLIDDNQFSSTDNCFNPVNTTNSNHLAYVIYTSGSTGKPKATMIEHRGCVNHCYAMIDTLDLKARDTIAQTAPIGFDISVWQILTMLLVGGRVCVIKNEIIQDPSRFFEEIEAEEISVVQVVPSLLATMLDICDHWGAKNLSHLRWLSVTGEAFNANLMHWWFKYYPSIPLLNAYGPAECSDDVTLYPIRYGENTELLNSNTIPIGKPIANTQIYILDADLNPLPIGVPGELYVGGIGVGRGYLNRPQLTSERFIVSPFSSNPEERLYKTGDLGCYLPDGNIEFLGRIDNQVKVRGFRIELGEIEATINTHPNVNQAVVIATGEGSGSKRLVAYVVTEQSLTNKQLRDFLKSHIPEYMVPSAFVTLDALPLTPNSKVDRKALPAPNLQERENQYLPPRTAIELELTQIWSFVIGINPIGVKDNFFDLGGHSLLAVRLISEIQKHFKVNLPLATLFQTPTIEELAVNIDSASSENLWSSLVPIQPKGSLPPLFFVGGEGGNVLCFQGLAQCLENQPFYGLEPPGLDGVTEPLGSIEEIASHYIKTIKSIQPVGPYYLGGHSFGGTVAFEMAQQLQNQGEEIAYIAILDSDPPTTELNHEDDNLNRDDDSRWINELVPMIEELFETNLQISDATLASIPPEKQLNYFKQQLEIVGILPPQSDIKLVRGLIQVYKTQSQIEIDYVPQNIKPTAIALFCAEEADSGEEDCERLLESQNAALGWNRLSQREVETHTVPGNHISMLNEPHVNTLAQTLQKSLEQKRILLGEEPFQINSK